MKYSVLIKAIVDVRVDGIDAESQLQAVQRVQDINLHSLIDKDGHVRSSGRSIRYLEYSDHNADTWWMRRTILSTREAAGTGTTERP